MRNTVKEHTYIYNQSSTALHPVEKKNVQNGTTMSGM
jgi:hypothetical protein